MLAGHEAVPGRGRAVAAKVSPKVPAKKARAATKARGTGVQRDPAPRGAASRAAAGAAPGRRPTPPPPPGRGALRDRADRVRRSVVAGASATRRTLLSRVPKRFHALTDEMAKFGTIGVINLGVNFAVFNALLLLTAMQGAEVKSKAVATVVATTCAYFLNRYWTYRNRPKTTLRREYALFFFFNAIGLVIETSFVAMAKYGLHETHFVVLNICSFLGIAVGTVFRFWAYRTHVFKPEVPLAEAEAETEAADQRAARRTAPDATARTRQRSKPGKAAQGTASPAVAVAGADDELDTELVRLEFDELVQDRRDAGSR